MKDDIIKPPSQTNFDEHLRTFLRRVLPRPIKSFLKKLLKLFQQLKSGGDRERDKTMRRELGETILLKSAADGSLEAIKMLQLEGVDVHAKNDSALLLAAAGGHVELFKYLALQGANIRHCNDLPFMLATTNGHVELLRYLHANGVDLRLRDGVALELAATNGHDELLRYLHVNGVDLRLRDGVALVLAATNGHVELLRYLHVNGVELHVRNDAALLAAAQRGHVRILKYLIEKGVNPGTQNNIALKLAADAGHVPAVEYLQRELNIGADKNIHAALKPLMYFYIDVFGHCNLRCPSCPVKNWPRKDKAFKAGLMSEELLREILNKATRETTVAQVGLFNWTEPLLNPNLPQLIQLVSSYGIKCSISSNLNIVHDAEALMRANPAWFRVSVSGFRQQVYELGHRGGDIEKVKKNMRLLSEAKTRVGATTELELFYHRYVDNQEDEALMKSYAEDLGYKILTGWAYMMPLEKVLKYADPDFNEAVLTNEDMETIDRMALKLNAMLDVCSRHKVSSCTLQDNFMALNVEGDVFLCCASSGRATNKLGNFLELSVREIQQLKRAHSLCGQCMSKGFPVYLNQTDPEFDKIGDKARAEFARESKLDMAI